MRNKVLASAATMAVTVLFTGMMLAADVDDDIDELEKRIDDLEDRVAALEVEVRLEGGSEPSGASGQDGEAGDPGNTSESTSSSTASNTSTSGSSSSSLASSVQSGSDSYQATYSSTGSRSIPFEIDVEGTYEIRVVPTDAFVLALESVAGAKASAFAIDTAGGGEVTAQGILEPGDYLLLVDSPGAWTMTMTLISGE